MRVYGHITEEFANGYGFIFAERVEHQADGDAKPISLAGLCRFLPRPPCRRLSRYAVDIPADLVTRFRKGLHYDELHGDEIPF